MKKLGKSLQERIIEKSKMFHDLMKLQDRKVLVGFTRLDTVFSPIHQLSCPSNNIH